MKIAYLFLKNFYFLIQKMVIKEWLMIEEAEELQLGVDE